MNIFGSHNAWDINRFGFGYVSTLQKHRAVTTSSNRIAAAGQLDQSFHVEQHVMRMRKAMEAIEPLLSGSSEIQVVSAASATSAYNLGLDLTETSTTMQSTEEVNATPTSFSPFGPALIGSTAQAAISGEYDGSNGTDTLTFKVTGGGTHGADNLKITVYDSNNIELDQINIKKSDALDRQYTLANGLVLSLGEGELIKNDTFTLDVVAAPASYSPSQPEWTAGSADMFTLDGAYDGSNGTDTLTFRVNTGGTHGVDDLQIKVYDSSDRQIDQINILSADPIDREYTLSNGLVLTLGEGDLLRDTSFSVVVSDSVGSAVDPDKAFNGVRNDNPNLEYGLSVANGSFQINGTTISVGEDDTINTVLDRINQSDAGVTATFDAGAEKILLTQNTPGSTPDIILENDTSGFLAAVKLDLASAIPGKDPDTEKPLDQVERFSFVQSGTIRVNGVSIDIDVNTDSLTDVLDRITAAGAEVSASFDSTSQKVFLNSDNPDRQLTLDSGATNFFAALEISDGTYNALTDIIQSGAFNVVNTPDLLVEYVNTYNAQPSEQDVEATPVTAADAKMLGTLVNIIAGSMNALFSDAPFTTASAGKTEEVRNNIRSAVAASFDSEGPRFKTDFGISFDFEKTDEKVFNFTPDDRPRFEAAVTSPQGLASVRNTLFGQEPGGLFTRLHAALTEATSNLELEDRSTGLYLDILA